MRGRPLSVMTVALYLGGLSLAPVAASDSVSISGESIAEQRPELETSIINSGIWTGQEDFPDATDWQNSLSTETLSLPGIQQDSRTRAVLELLHLQVDMVASNISPHL
ncbi:hypothetical protein Efla_007625 [Eimeria flavescens]